MNKILIVGHPSSNYQEIEVLLHQCGMKPALPSRRDNLLPQEISAILCKAYGATPINELTLENIPQQLKIEPIWHGMILDLMLGNLDQMFYGWADPQAIYLLNYWKELDANLTFILVYDEPHCIFAGNENKEIPHPATQNISNHLNNWIVYNNALLSFHLQNPERSLLINAKQARISVESYLQQLQPLLGLELLVPEHAAVAGNNAQKYLLSASSAPTLLPAFSQALEIVNVDDTHMAAQLLNITPIEDYLIESIFAQYPAILQLYDELQQVANLPLNKTTRMPSNPTLALEVLVRQYSFITQMVDKLGTEHQNNIKKIESLNKSSELLLTQLHQVQKKLKSTTDNANIKHQHDTKTVTNLTEENELLLTQLHQVQEELERYYLENKKLKQRLPPPKPKGIYGAANRIKQHLSYRLGAVMIQKSRSLGGWLSLPWALAAEVQAFRKEFRTRQGEKLPPIHTYLDAHEAELIKQDLLYILGSTSIAHSKSPLGWLKMPFALRLKLLEFRQQQNLSRACL